MWPNPTYDKIGPLSVHAYGTTLTNRKFYPKKACSKEKDWKKKWFWFWVPGRTVSCVVWRDNRLFISSLHNPAEVTTVDRRKRDGELDEILIPMLIKDYNTYMGGCDKSDQIVRLNRARRHYCWLWRLFMNFFSLGVLQCFCALHKYRPARTPSKKKTFKFFLDQVCLSLVGTHRSRAVCRQPCNKKFRSVSNLLTHISQRCQMMTLQIMCVLCAWQSTLNTREQTLEYHTRITHTSKQKQQSGVDIVSGGYVSKGGQHAGRIGTPKLTTLSNCKYHIEDNICAFEKCTSVHVFVQFWFYECKVNLVKFIKFPSKP